jgi:uncharacterized membrane protein
MKNIKIPAGICFVVILAIGIILRFWGLSNFSIWTDEQDTLMQSRHFSEIWSHRGNGAFYFMLQNLWRVLLGDSPYAIRSLSAVFGCLSILLAAKAVLQITQDRKAALAAAFFCAVFPLLVWHSRDARMYPVWGAACLIAMSALLRFRQIGLTKELLIVYTLANAFALLSHNYHLFFLVGFGAAAFLHPDRKQALWLHTPILVAGLVMAVRLLVISGFDWNYFKAHFFSTSDFRILPSLFEITQYRNPALSQFGDPVVGLGVLIVLLGGSVLVYRKQYGREFLLSMWLPFVLIHALPIRDYPRLFYPFALYLGMLLGMALVRWPARNLILKRIFIAGQCTAFIGICVYIAAPLHQALTVDMEPWKAFCRRASALQEGRWIISETLHPESPIAQCNLTRQEVMVYSPKHVPSDSPQFIAFLTALNKNDFTFIRSPPWVQESQSLMRYFDEGKYEKVEVPYGEYLRVIFYNRLR